MYTPIVISDQRMPRETAPWIIAKLTGFHFLSTRDLRYIM